MLLDLGCGSGMSGSIIAAAGHAWVGFDISLNMLALAAGLPTDACHASPQGMSTAQQAPQQPKHCLPPEPEPPSAHATKSRTGFNALNHRTNTQPVQLMAQPRGKGLVVLSDVAQGIPLRQHSFDGAISISAVQWLCHHPDAKTTLGRLFSSLFGCLKQDARAVLQVYIAGTPASC